MCNHAGLTVCPTSSMHAECSTSGMHAECSTVGMHAECATSGMHAECPTAGMHAECPTLGMHAECSTAGRHGSEVRIPGVQDSRNLKASRTVMNSFVDLASKCIFSVNFEKGPFGRGLG